jgi:hypothetical protein
MVGQQKLEENVKKKEESTQLIVIMDYVKDADKRRNQ